LAMRHRAGTFKACLLILVLHTLCNGPWKHHITNDLQQILICNDLLFKSSY
jgi:hypothetical protein